VNDQKVYCANFAPTQTVAPSFGQWIRPFKSECYSRSGEFYWLLPDQDERLR